MDERKIARRHLLASGLAAGLSAVFVDSRRTYPLPWKKKGHFRVDLIIDGRL